MNNRFIANKKKIEEISKARGVDVRVATSMYIAETNMQDYDKELKEFERILMEYQKSGDKTLADFFNE